MAPAVGRRQEPARATSRGDKLIQYKAFVVCDVVLAQDGDKFFVERDLTMMFILMLM
jgi:hypothetical protein